MTFHVVNISPSTMLKPAEILKQQFLKSLGLPWRDILPESRLDELLEEEEISERTRVYTPSVNLWAMLYQVLSADKSLSNTLKCITTWLTAAGVKPPSSDTGAYSKAQSRLAEKLLQRLIPELVGYARTRLSLQGTRQQFNQMLALLATATNTIRDALYCHLLEVIATEELPHRTHRQEPRVVKRRPKPFPRMRQPRSILKAKLVA